MRRRIRVRRGRSLVGCTAVALVMGIVPVTSAGAQVTEPLEITLEVTPNGVVNSTSGAAVIRGEIQCSRAQKIDIYGNAEQGQGDERMTAGDYQQFDCSGEPQLWTLALEPSRGSFQKGFVDASVTAYYYPDDTVENVEATVRLQEICSIVGTPENDELRGFPGDDRICGLGGDDIINGRGGSDRIVGGPGADVLRGGGGKDTLIGGPGAGANRLVGGPGRDRCKRETRRDVLRSCETKI